MPPTIELDDFELSADEATTELNVGLITGSTAFTVASNGSTSFNNGVDLGANAIDNVGNIDINQGSAIRDDTGTDRLNINSTSTVLRKDTKGAIISGEENVTKLFTAGSDGNIRVADLNSSGPFDLSPLAQDFRLATGQSVEDGGGTNRLDVLSASTRIRDETGQPGVYLGEGNRYGFNAQSGTPVTIYDAVGGFTGVQYDPNSTTGVLRTPNAGMRVGANNAPSSGQGLELKYDKGTSRSILTSFDRTNSVHKDIDINASTIRLTSESGLIDLSDKKASLRLATGNNIEDGGGTARFGIDNSGTFLRDQSGNLAVLANDGFAVQMYADSATPWRIRDEQQGTNDAVVYKTGSTIGSLTLANSVLETGSGITASSGAIRLENSQSIKWRNDGDTADARIRVINKNNLELIPPSTSSNAVTFGVPNDANVGTGDIGPNVATFAVDDSNNDLVAYTGDDDTQGQFVVGSYSTERLKQIEGAATVDSETFLDATPKRYVKGNGDGNERVGFTAEQLHDLGLTDLVTYVNKDDARQTHDGISDEYLDQYGVKRDEEIVVPNDIDERAMVAYLLTEIKELKEKVEN